MFLATKRQKPLIAQHDIRVFQYVNSVNTDAGTARLSDSRDTIELDKVLSNPNSLRIQENTDYNFFVVGGGAYYSYLWPYLNSRNNCLNAYIPKGTEYWVGVDGTTVCSRKIVVENSLVGENDITGLDEEIAEWLYLHAPVEEGIRVGDFIAKGSGGSEIVVDPYNFNRISNYRIKGVVVGFHDSLPIVANIFDILQDLAIDEDYDSNLGGRFFTDVNEAENDFCGWEHSRKWKQHCCSDPHRFPAWNALDGIFGGYYMPALGEMKMLFKNITLIAAACALAKVNMPISMGEWFWTSTEYSSGYCWVCCLGSLGLYRDWDDKDDRSSIVPFVASVRKLISNNM